VDASELKQIVDIFIHETGETLSQFEECLRSLERESGGSFPSEKMIRSARSLRGSSAALGFTVLSIFAQSLETSLLAMKKQEVKPNAEIISAFWKCRDFVAEHIQCIRAGKVPQSEGRELMALMQRLSDPNYMAIKIELPRPPSAGDIWFVGDDLKAVLFEMPEVAPLSEELNNQSETEQFNLTVEDKSARLEAEQLDAKLSSLQAEIARLTRLAAQVNQTTVESALTDEATSADALPQASAGEPETDLPPASVQQPEGYFPPATVQQPEGYFPPATVRQPEAYLPRIPSEDTAAYLERISLVLNSVTSAKTSEQQGAITSQRSESPEAQAEKNEIRNESAREEPRQTSGRTVVTDSPASVLTDEKVRLSTEKIDRLSDYVGELIILQSIFEEQSQDFHSPLFQKSISQMAKVLREMQDLTSQFRLVSVRPLFSKLQRLIHRDALTLNKEVVVSTSGDETAIDKVLLDHIADPVIALIRHSLEHGLESTNERVRAGKPPKGSLWVSAFQQEKSIVIEIRDDGYGLDPQKLRTQAIQRGLISPFEKISDDELKKLIFHAGFFARHRSPLKHSENLALDEVKAKIQTLQGQIEIDSQQGSGNCFRLSFPLVIRVIDAFIVKIGRERFVIPKNHVTETIRPHEADIYRTHGSDEMLNLRGQAIPLFYLPVLLSKQPPSAQKRSTFDGIALVFGEDSNRKFAVIVDDVVCQQQVVLKRLGAELQNIGGLDGASVLGDGKPALILDVKDLVRSKSGGQLAEGPSPFNNRAA
jgi:two-component system chemotaxis sensor kinase CheA